MALENESAASNTAEMEKLTKKCERLKANCREIQLELSEREKRIISERSAAEEQERVMTEATLQLQAELQQARTELQAVKAGRFRAISIHQILAPISTPPPPTSTLSLTLTLALTVTEIVTATLRLTLEDNLDST